VTAFAGLKSIANFGTKPCTQLASGCSELEIPVELMPLTAASKLSSFITRTN
jgi:hypothetical protein